MVSDYWSPYVYFSQRICTHDLLSYWVEVASLCPHYPRALSVILHYGPFNNIYDALSGGKRDKACSDLQTVVGNDNFLDSR